MRVEFTHAFRLSLILVILALVSQPLMVLTGAKVKTGASSPALAAAAPGAPRAGGGDPLGSFKMHVQIQQRRVEVKDQEGGAAPTRLVAEFAAWDPQSRVVTINVAIKNVGAAALSGSPEAMS